MSIHQKARFLQSRQRLRSLRRQLSLLSRLSSEIRVNRVEVDQIKPSYRRAIYQPPLSIEVTEEEIIQRYHSESLPKKTFIEPVVRHLRGSQIRSTVLFTRLFNH